MWWNVPNCERGPGAARTLREGGSWFPALLGMRDGRVAALSVSQDVQASLPEVVFGVQHCERLGCVHDYRVHDSDACVSDRDPLRAYICCGPTTVAIVRVLHCRVMSKSDTLSHELPNR